MARTNYQFEKRRKELAKKKKKEEKRKRKLEKKKLGESGPDDGQITGDAVAEQETEETQQEGPLSLEG